MGNLYNRNGTWYADYFDRAGRRRRESTKTGDVKVARARLRDLELATTDRAAHETETLDASLKYFVDVACAGRSPGTATCYQQKSRHVSRLIGGELVDRLKRETVERYIATRLEEGAHRHSVHKELVVLRGALKSSKSRERFHGGLDIVPEFDSGYVPRTVYVTPDQFLELVPHLVRPAPPNASPATIAKLERCKQRRALYCMLIAFASPRRGELEALRWEFVDLARNVLRIPKGKTFSRPIAIHEVLRPWLEAMHEGSGPVVEPWSNVVRDLSWAVDRANDAAAAIAAELDVDPPAPIPRITPNDLRRTFASWLVQAGVSLYVVSRLLGHKSTRMVEMVYGQLDDATLMHAIAKLPGGCAAGVSHAAPNHGTGGTTGTTPSSTTITNSVEESFASQTSVVPRNGVEPPTRGFSGLADLAPKRSNLRALLRVVK